MIDLNSMTAELYIVNLKLNSGKAVYSQRLSLLLYNKFTIKEG